MSTDALFDATPYEVPSVTVDTTGMGHDAARTARQRALLDAGTHPATKLPLLISAGQTCGTCDHLILKRYSHTWFKCGLQIHNGTGLDIRKSWPACTAWADGRST